MIEVGQRFYRYRFSLSEGKPEVVLHTFEVTKIEELECAWGVRTELTTKCLENPKSIKLYDGRVSPENLALDCVRPCGDYKFVLLEEDDYPKACRLVCEYLEETVVAQKRKLNHMHNELSNAYSLFEH